MKRALLISPYFTPSNLAGAQRVRLMASRLDEFGWQPVVVTVDPRHYEEPGDPASLALIAKNLRVERVRALPTRLCRALGFGDISLRAQWALRRKVAELVKRREADLIFVTVLPGCASLIGAWAKRRFGLPFVLDYQDPWVSDWGAKQPPWSKAGLAHRLAVWLEPRVVPQADAITAVSDATLDSLRQRGLLDSRKPVEIVPIGAEPSDHEAARRIGQSQICKQPGLFDLVYLGTLVERMLPALKVVLRALAEIARAQPQPRLRLHLIGTSGQPEGEDRLKVSRLADECGASRLLHLEPRRVGYLDALRTMQDADLLLLLGSTDSHYTASKLFPCWLARRPILGVFHEASTVPELGRQLGGVRLVTYGSNDGVEAHSNEAKLALCDLIAGKAAAVPLRHEEAFTPHSALGIGAVYAGLMDRVSGTVSRK